MTVARIGCMLVVWPFAELIILLWAAATWGWQPVALIVIGSFLLGLVIIRVGMNRTGRSWSQAMKTLQLRNDMAAFEHDQTRAIEESPFSEATRPHYAPPAQTMLLIPAGVAIAIPGFLSDLVGLAMLLPAIRRRIALRWATGWDRR